MSVCIAVDSTTKYIQNVEIITNRLNNLIQKSALEEYIQDNRLFISCFISPFYRCNKKTIVPVEKLQFFFNWWEKLSLERKRIVLNNLWVRFDTINRRVINDLPF
jgi:serine/threonine-protein kinase